MSDLVEIAAYKKRFEDAIKRIQKASGAIATRHVTILISSGGNDFKLASDQLIQIPGYKLCVAITSGKIVEPDTGWGSWEYAEWPIDNRYGKNFFEGVATALEELAIDAEQRQTPS